MHPYICILKFCIPSYGIMIVIGIAVAMAFILKMCKSQTLLFENALIIGFTGIGMGLIFAKLLYFLITYSFEEIVNIINSGGINYLISGGYVYYGGFIGGILGAHIGKIIANCVLKDYSDIIITSLPLAHTFGRIGCFFAGCCYGAPTNLFLGISYTRPLSSAPTGIPLIPIQLIEASANFLIFLILLNKLKKNRKNMLSLYILMYSSIRFILEFFRYDKERGDIIGMSTSQSISLLLITLAIIFLIMKKERKSK